MQSNPVPCLLPLMVWACTSPRDFLPLWLAAVHDDVTQLSFLTALRSPRAVGGALTSPFSVAPTVGLDRQRTSRRMPSGYLADADSQDLGNLKGGPSIDSTAATVATSRYLLQFRLLQRAHASGCECLQNSMRSHPPTWNRYISFHNDAATATLSSSKQEEAQCLSLQMMPDSQVVESNLLAIYVEMHLLERPT